MESGRFALGILTPSLPAPALSPAGRGGTPAEDLAQGSASTFDGPSGAFDGAAITFDGSSVVFDGSTNTFDGPSITFDDSASTFDDSSSTFDDSSSTFDGPSVAFDGSSIAFDGSSLVFDGSSVAFDGTSIASDGPPVMPVFELARRGKGEPQGWISTVVPLGTALQISSIWAFSEPIQPARRRPPSGKCETSFPDRVL
ncbi:MAG TPA: hypothetical protein VF173_18250 [Thermoanaerobaculia bacterium]|nr:hypothetical protein [Thermoanaerobaculia bacterium]